MRWWQVRTYTDNDPGILMNFVSETETSLYLHSDDSFKYNEIINELDSSGFDEKDKHECHTDLKRIMQIKKKRARIHTRYGTCTWKTKPFFCHNVNCLVGLFVLFYLNSFHFIVSVVICLMRFARPHSLCRLQIEYVFVITLHSTCCAQNFA